MDAAFVVAASGEALAHFTLRPDIGVYGGAAAEPCKSCGVDHPEVSSIAALLTALAINTGSCTRETVLSGMGRLIMSPVPSTEPTSPPHLLVTAHSKACPLLWAQALHRAAASELLRVVAGIGAAGAGMQWPRAHRKAAHRVLKRSVSFSTVSLFLLLPVASSRVPRDVRALAESPVALGRRAMPASPSDVPPRAAPCSGGGRWAALAAAPWAYFGVPPGWGSSDSGPGDTDTDASAVPLLDVSDAQDLCFAVVRGTVRWRCRVRSVARRRCQGSAGGPGGHRLVVHLSLLPEGEEEAAGGEALPPPRLGAAAAAAPGGGGGGRAGAEAGTTVALPPLRPMPPARRPAGSSLGGGGRAPGALRPVVRALVSSASATILDPPFDIGRAGSSRAGLDAPELQPRTASSVAGTSATNDVPPCVSSGGAHVATHSAAAPSSEAATSNGSEALLIRPHTESGESGESGMAAPQSASSSSVERSTAAASPGVARVAPEELEGVRRRLDLGGGAGGGPGGVAEEDGKAGDETRHGDGLPAPSGGRVVVEPPLSPPPRQEKHQRDVGKAEEEGGDAAAAPGGSMDDLRPAVMSPPQQRRPPSGAGGGRRPWFRLPLGGGGAAAREQAVLRSESQPPPASRLLAAGRSSVIGGAGGGLEAAVAVLPVGATAAALPATPARPLVAPSSAAAATASGAGSALPPSPADSLHHYADPSPLRRLRDPAGDGGSGTVAGPRDMPEGSDAGGLPQLQQQPTIQQKPPPQQQPGGGKRSSSVVRFFFRGGTSRLSAGPTAQRSQTSTGQPAAPTTTLPLPQALTPAPPPGRPHEPAKPPGSRFAPAAAHLPWWRRALFASKAQALAPASTPAAASDGAHSRADGTATAGAASVAAPRIISLPLPPAPAPRHALLLVGPRQPGGCDVLNVELRREPPPPPPAGFGVDDAPLPASVGAAAAGADIGTAGGACQWECVALLSAVMRPLAARLGCTPEDLAILVASAPPSPSVHAAADAAATAGRGWDGGGVAIVAVASASGSLLVHCRGERPLRLPEATVAAPGTPGPAHSGGVGAAMLLLPPPLPTHAIGCACPAFFGVLCPGVADAGGPISHVGGDPRDAVALFRVCAAVQAMKLSQG